MRSLIVITCIFFSSCTGSNESTHSVSDVLVKDIKNRINKNSSLIENLEASGTISIDSPELSNSASLEIKIKKPDSVYVNIEGPFGIDIASAIITRTDFIYYNAQENKVITGPTNDVNIGAILKIKITFDELLNSFCASFSFVDDLQDSTYAPLENENYVISENAMSYKNIYLIEPVNYTLNAYVRFDNDKKKLFEVNYSKYNLETSSKGDVNFPNKIKIFEPDKKQTVWVDYDSKEINKKNITFKLKVPKSAKVIKWDQ